MCEDGLGVLLKRLVVYQLLSLNYGGDDKVKHIMLVGNGLFSCTFESKLHEGKALL